MIIFLDFDGVIATAKSYDEYDNLLDRKCCKALNVLTDHYNAKIVISSTWRMEGIDHLRDILKDAGVKAEVIDVTPRLHEKMFLSAERGEEIKEWIRMNNYDGDYLILDDEVTDIIKHHPSEKVIHLAGGFRGDGLTIDIVQSHIKKV